MSTREIYSPEEVESIVRLVAENPRGFVRMYERMVPAAEKSLTSWELKQSLRSWDINPDAGIQPTSDHWTARFGEDNSPTTPKK